MFLTYFFLFLCFFFVSKGTPNKTTNVDVKNDFNVVTSSTPVKQVDVVTVKSDEDDFQLRLEGLKKNVNDTLTFLHQERNDFLPKDDIIIPLRKSDHVSMDIDLDSIKKDNNNKKGVLFLDIDNVQSIAENEVTEIVKQAEDVVNKEIESETDLPGLRESDVDDVIARKNLNATSNELLLQLKSEEAFRFLENESYSPIATPNDFGLDDADNNRMDVIDSNRVVNFKMPDSPTKIPVPKPRQNQQQSNKNIDSDDPMSPSDADILSKIPVPSKGKMKTIKKHSKDPLKEFVNLSKDVNWDETDDVVVIETHQATDPIVKTTVTRITNVPSSSSSSSPEATRSKIPILQTETLTSKELLEKFDLTQKTSPLNSSKIPVLLQQQQSGGGGDNNNGTRLLLTSPDSIKSFDSNLISPSSDAKYSMKSSTIDSDSETDSRRSSPPLKGILKKASFRTIGSSSGSDIALHEPGAESSEDESGAYQK